MQRTSAATAELLQTVQVADLCRATSTRLSELLPVAHPPRRQAAMRRAIQALDELLQPVPTTELMQVEPATPGPTFDVALRPGPSRAALPQDPSMQTISRGRAIPDEILHILAECTVEENLIKLPARQLERKTYEAVNKILLGIGGKWNRRAKGHVFQMGDAETLLQAVLMTGQTVDVRKELQFFPTPPEVADRMCHLAELSSQHVVLEPSAGRGHLAQRILAHVAGVEVIEQHQSFREELRAQGRFAVLSDTDFLAYAGQHERIVMNPPFNRQQDIQHVLHAYDCLAPGGILVSVTSPGWQFRVDWRSQDFRTWLDAVQHEVEELPEDAFASSGTHVRTRLVKIHKEA